MTAPRVRKPTFVYVLLDVDDEPIYVGCSQNLQQRRTAHRQEQWWWPDVNDWHIIGPFVSRERALAHEAKLIRLLEPRYNTAHAPARRMVSLAEKAVDNAYRDYRYCFRYGRPATSEAELARAEARLDRAWRQLRRHRRERAKGVAA